MINIELAMRKVEENGALLAYEYELSARSDCNPYSERRRYAQESQLIDQWLKPETIVLSEFSSPQAPTVTTEFRPANENISQSHDISPLNQARLLFQIHLKESSSKEEVLILCEEVQAVFMNKISKFVLDYENKINISAEVAAFIESIKDIETTVPPFPGRVTLEGQRPGRKNLFVPPETLFH